jgi:hypothetical protein
MARRQKQEEAPSFTLKDDEAAVIPGIKKINIQRLGRELERLTAEGGGELRPVAVVEAARDPSSILHRLFEWDDSKAAEKYRVSQARAVIRIVRIENDNTDSGTVRAFISISSDQGGRSYRPIVDILQSSDLRDRVLAQAERELHAFKARYSELKDAFGFIDDIIETVRARRTKKKPAAEPRANA